MADSQKPRSSVVEYDGIGDAVDDMTLMDLIAAHPQPDAGFATHLSMHDLESISEGDIGVADDSFQNARESTQQFQRPLEQSTRIKHLDFINPEMINAFDPVDAIVCDEDDHSLSLRILHPTTGNSTTLKHDVDAEMQLGRNTTSGSSSASTAIIPAALLRSHNPREGVVFRLEDEAATTTTNDPTRTEAVHEWHRAIEGTILQGSCEPSPSSSSSSPLSNATTAVASASPLAPPPSSQPPPIVHRSIRFAVAQGLTAAHEVAAHSEKIFDRQTQSVNLLNSTFSIARISHRLRRRREMSNENENEVETAEAEEEKEEESPPAKRPRLILRRRPQRD